MTTKKYNFSRHELIDSEPQWREVQRRKNDGVQRAVVSFFLNSQTLEYKF